MFVNTYSENKQDLFVFQRETGKNEHNCPALENLCILKQFYDPFLTEHCMQLNDIIIYLNNILWNWPLIILFIGTSLCFTLALRCIQVRYFFAAWKFLLKPDRTAKAVSADMSPLQAFLNALSASLGNGSIGGMATALYSGGPGAALWMFLFGLLAMPIRYAEIYLSTTSGTKQLPTGPVGGPMAYLSRVGGTPLAYLYAFFCFCMALTMGNAIQANTVALGFVRIFDVSTVVIASVLFLFIVYVMFGGAARIVAVSDAIVPVKVGVFFLLAVVALWYHKASLIPALTLIIQSACSAQALAGGALGYSAQQAMRFGISRTLNAAEAGLGTAAVLFGGTTSKHPVRDALMSMISTFISANLVCFVIALIIIASGVWNNGQTSLNLTISAFETVFGTAGGWLVTFLSVSFGLGVLVAYAYIARACWLFLTGGRMVMLCNLIFCIVTFLGALAKVDLVWNMADLINAGLLAVNLCGLLFLLPIIYRGLHAYEKKQH